MPAQAEYVALGCGYVVLPARPFVAELQGRMEPTQVAVQQCQCRKGAEESVLRWLVCV